MCVCLLAREAELAMCRCNCLSCNTERRRAWRHSTALRPSVWRCSCDKATSESPKVRDCNTSKPPSQQRAVALLWEHEKAQSDFSVSSAPPVKTAESDRIGSAQAKSPQKHFELALRCRITHTYRYRISRAPPVLAQSTWTGQFVFTNHKKNAPNEPGGNPETKRPKNGGEEPTKPTQGPGAMGRANSASVYALPGARLEHRAWRAAESSPRKTRWRARRVESGDGGATAVKTFAAETKSKLVTLW